MSISCEISWEKFASLLHEFQTCPKVVYIESTLKSHPLIFQSGTVLEILHASRSVTFKLNSGQSKKFEFLNAAGFTLSAGTTGTWELSADIPGEGRVAFTAAGDTVDEPLPMPTPQPA